MSFIIITVTQSVDIELKVGSITTSFDGSTFPESIYRATYTINTGSQVLSGGASATLRQSSYKNAVDKDKFKERGHPNKYRKKLTY